MIKLIIFDLDGVLVEAKNIHFEAFNKALGEYAISWDEHLSTYDGLKTNQKLEMLHERKGLPNEYFNEKLQGVDQYACGFAWVNIYGIKGNTKLGRAMKAAGFRKSYDGAWQIWNPSKFPCQNVDTLEAGAIAAQNVFRKYGFTAYAGSRLD